MLFSIIVASSLTTVLLALGLARERRLRLALERLVARILKLWRHQHDDNGRGRDAES